MEPAQVERPAPAPERVVARTPLHRHTLKTSCPELRRHSHSHTLTV
jgi:hypothetical protein